MIGNYFYKDRAGGQNGPVSLEELHAIARSGRLAPDCLVWTEGGEPQQAGKTPGLAELLGSPSSLATPSGQGPLIGDIPGWGLLWRLYVLVLGMASLVFAPLAGRWYHRFLAGRVSLPNGRRLLLESGLSSCWWMFVAMAALVWAPAVIALAIVGSLGPHADPSALQALDLQLLPLRLATNVATFVLSYFVVRWFVRSLRSEDGALGVVFTGGFWAFFGWDLLIVLSFITIIGWAWALKGKMAWMCRRVEGTHAFAFVGTGWQILWRTFVAFGGAGLVIGLMAGVGGALANGGRETAGGVVIALAVIVAFLALSLAIRWVANWYVSQIVVTPAAASASDEQRAAA